MEHGNALGFGDPQSDLNQRPSLDAFLIMSEFSQRAFLTVELAVGDIVAQTGHLQA